ncbi:MAG: LysM peptidoglycan-binding domain-containing protein [Lysobacterales bacterium]
MGIFDSIKNAFGKGEAEVDVTVPPSKLLRDAGLDPSGLKFAFGTGSITVSGEIADESQRRRILDVLSGIGGIKTVQDEMVVAAPRAAPTPAPTPTPTPAPEPPVAVQEVEAEGGAGTRSYTVVSGDTLWKIAERMYGNGSHYMKIFEANTDVLEHPDRIFPGQKLVIPEL